MECLAQAARQRIATGGELGPDTRIERVAQQAAPHFLIAGFDLVGRENSRRPVTCTVARQVVVASGNTGARGQCRVTVARDTPMPGGMGMRTGLAMGLADTAGHQQRQPQNKQGQMVSQCHSSSAGDLFQTLAYAVTR